MQSQAKKLTKDGAWSVSATRPSALLLLAAGCLLWSGLSVAQTHHFVATAVRASGRIFHSTGGESNTVLAEVRSPAGRVERTVPVCIAWWMPPWSYRRGMTVSILYDPHGDYVTPLIGRRGRVDAWAQMWAAPACGVWWGSSFWCSGPGLQWSAHG